MKTEAQIYHELQMKMTLESSFGHIACQLCCAAGLQPDRPYVYASVIPEGVTMSTNEDRTSFVFDTAVPTDVKHILAPNWIRFLEQAVKMR